MKTIHTYKGYNVLADFSKPVQYNVVNGNGLILNKNKNMYSCEIQTKNKKSTHIHCHIYESNNQEKFAYIEKEIDKELERRKRDIQKQFIEHRQSSMIEYIFSNLKITVINTPDYYSIYVNDNPLRLSLYCLMRERSDIDSIMYYIHTKKIALYNITPLHKQKTKWIQNKKTIILECPLIPIYNYIGNIFKYKERLFVLTNVSSNYSNMIILESKPLDNLKQTINIEISPSEIYNQIELYENKLTDNYLIDFICIKNKINFFE